MSKAADKIRFGIIGAGNIARQHAANLSSGAVPGAVLTAISSRHELTDELDELKEQVRHFADYQAMLVSGEVDAVLIATPTMDHRTMGEAVCASGLHLVMEKPLAMSLADAQRLIACQQTDQHFAVMLNQRFDPTYQAIKTCLQRNLLGRLQRVSWTMTNWYRPDIYFHVSEWRGTWRGEGGGLLLNQCIHNLDILQWLVGMPASVTAQASFGKYHDIEVEDEIAAVMRFGDSMIGTFTASTGEAPGINQLDIVGDQGTLRFDGAKIEVQTTDESVAQHLFSTTEMFGMPQFERRELPVAAPVNQHAALLGNVVDAILGEDSLNTPAAEGLASLELANAMLLAAWSQGSVPLPLDAAAYQVALDERIADSRLRRAQDLPVNIDLGKSFR